MGFLPSHLCTHKPLRCFSEGLPCLGMNSKKPRSLPMALLPPAVGVVVAVLGGGGEGCGFQPRFLGSRSSLRDPLGLPLEPPPRCSPPGRIPAAALSALCHLSPPFLLLSVFQKCVEIPHLVTPRPPLLIVGLYLFLFLHDYIKGSLGGRGDKYTCSKYVKQIICTKHSAQYLLNKCQLLLKLSPALVVSWGVRGEV